MLVWCGVSDMMCHVRNAEHFALMDSDTDQDWMTEKTPKITVCIKEDSWLVNGDPEDKNIRKWLLLWIFDVFKCKV